MVLLKFTNLTKVKMGMLIQEAKNKGLKFKLAGVCDTQQNLIIFCPDYMELLKIREDMCKILEPAPLFNDLASLDLHLDFDTFFIINKALEHIFHGVASTISNGPKPLLQILKGFEGGKIALHIVASETTLSHQMIKIIGQLKLLSQQVEKDLKECLDYFRQAKPVSLAFQSTATITLTPSYKSQQECKKIVTTILQQNPNPATQELLANFEKDEDLSWLTEPKTVSVTDPELLKAYLMILAKQFKETGQCIDQALKELGSAELIFEVVA